jgi:hypothetical protein
VRPATSSPRGVRLLFRQYSPLARGPDWGIQENCRHLRQFADQMEFGNLIVDADGVRLWEPAKPPTAPVRTIPLRCAAVRRSASRTTTTPSRCGARNPGSPPLRQQARCQGLNMVVRFVYLSPLNRIGGAEQAAAPPRADEYTVPEGCRRRPILRNFSFPCHAVAR